MSCARYFNPRLRVLLLTAGEPAWLQRHPRRRYIIACVIAALPWPGERERIASLRDEATRLTLSTGVLHVLDHIIPLNHPYVCGLHIGVNLRVVPWAVNACKGNRWSPDQLELLDEAAA
jgi:hypothetical protein